MLDAAADTLEMLAGETPSTSLAHDEVVGADPLELFCRTPLAKSKGEIRRNSSGYYLNQVGLAERDGGEAAAVTDRDLLHGRFLLLQRGRKARHLIVIEP